MILNKVSGLLLFQLFAYLFRLNSQVPVNFQPLISSTMQREVELVQSLIIDTNIDFSRNLLSKIQSPSNQITFVSYELVSFIFYYPNSTNHISSAYSEMGTFDGIRLSRGKIEKVTLNTNQIPLNYVRLIKFDITEPIAEVNLLLNISSNDKAQYTRYTWRSIRYVFKGSWKEIAP